MTGGDHLAIAPMQPGPFRSSYRIRGQLLASPWLGMVMFAMVGGFLAWKLLPCSTMAWALAITILGVFLAAIAFSAGLQELRVVELGPAGLTLRYTFRRGRVDMARISSAEIVGPEAFGLAMRILHGLWGARQRAWCRSRQFGAVDLFGGVGREMVVLHVIARRPVILHMERPAEFVAELTELLAARPASVPVPQGRSPLDKWHWVQFALPALIPIAFVGCFLAWGIYMRVQTTPLHRAAKGGDVAEVKRLIAERPELLNEGNHLGYTPLRLAVERSPAVVAALLDAGADTEAADAYGSTPLHYAVLNRADREVLALLLEHGADVNARDNQGQAPLHLAAKRHRVDAARLLLGQGAQVNARDDGGRTPLSYAMPTNRGPDPKQQEVYELLRSHGGRE